MSKIELRPPLPAPLSHAEVPFVKSPQTLPTQLSPSTVAVIAASLDALLPEGDFIATGNGVLRYENATPTPWLTAARLSAIEREPR